MKRRAVLLLATVVLAGLLMAACTQAAPPAPTQVPSPPSKAAEPTKAAAPTAVLPVAGVPSPTAKYTPTAVPLTSVSSEEVVWTDVLRSVRDVSPVLRPRSLPAGLESVRMRDAGQGTFWVEYSGPDKRLGVGAGTFNPPIVTVETGGAQRKVTVRGQEAMLQFRSRARPSESVQLWWEEPGRWIMGPGASVQDRVFYMVGASDVDPDVVLQLANSLGEMDQPIDLAPTPTELPAAHP